MTGDSDHDRRLEVQSRKADAPHPDRCAKLHLRGVAFALPPRGLRVYPIFDAAGEATVRVDGVDRWPRIPGLLKRLARRLRRRRLTFNPTAPADLLCDVMALAREALLTQYDLSDAHVADLLSFDADQRPPWIGELLSWAQGASRE